MIPGVLNFLYVLATIENLTFDRVVEPLDQWDNWRLSWTWMPDNGHDFVFWRFKRNAFQNFHILVFGIIEFDWLKSDASVFLWRTLSVGPRLFCSFGRNFWRCYNHDRHFISGAKDLGHMLDVVRYDSGVEHECSNVKKYGCNFANSKFKVLKSRTNYHYNGDVACVCQNSLG